MATISAREFNHDVSAAKRAADQEPVIITDRGTPSHVLLSYADYLARLAGDGSIVERLMVDDDLDLEVEPLRLEARTVDL